MKSPFAITDMGSTSPPMRTAVMLSNTLPVCQQTRFASQNNKKASHELQHIGDTTAYLIVQERTHIVAIDVDVVAFQSKRHCKQERLALDEGEPPGLIQHIQPGKVAYKNILVLQLLFGLDSPRLAKRVRARMK